MIEPAAIVSQVITKKAYFEIVELINGRVEFHDGRLKHLLSGTADHSRITLDTGHYLTEHSSADSYGNDCLISVPKYDSYLFADISYVSSASAKFESRRALLNPDLLVEVVSASSGDYDRGEKFQKYRSLHSFREYLLIDSRRYAVECWYREDGNTWRLDAAFSRDENVYLHTLKVELPLAEVYRRVCFVGQHN